MISFTHWINFLIDCVQPGSVPDHLPSELQTLMVFPTKLYTLLQEYVALEPQVVDW